MSGVLLWMTYTTPEVNSLSSSLSSVYWPRIVLWALLCSSLLLAAARWWNVNEPEVSAESAGGEGSRVPIASLLCCAAYFALLGQLGFLVSTLLFCAVFPVVIGYRSWPQLAAFSFGVTVAVWLIFIKVMKVTLPRGTGIFRDVSLLLY